MKRTLLFSQTLVALFASTTLFGAPIPIQRVDLANMLWNSTIATQTPVLVTFNNSNASPCFSATLAFADMMTVFAGIGQSCVTPITSISITPVIGPSGLGPVYAPPADTALTNTYSAEIFIANANAPVFDPDNGSVLTLGTVAISLQQRFIHN